MQEFARRRKRLMHLMGDEGIAILSAARQQRRNRDVEFPYRQDSDFHYLTGFPEPDAIAVIMPGRAHGEYVLFCQERDPEKEIWTGRRVGQEDACRLYGADDAFPIGDLDDILPGLLEKSPRVYYAMGADETLDRKLMEWLNQLRAKARSGVHAPQEFIALDHLLHEMRLFKRRAELAAMRIAARITADAHRRVMRACRPGMKEYQIEAEFLHEIVQAGCRSTAYPPIVAAGANACVLHYTANSAPLVDGDLLLIDAGAEHENYAADVTRTFPINGVFSETQLALYEIVLEAQSAAIKKAIPGNHWNDPHEAAVRTITKGLVEIGILKGQVSKLIKAGAYREFFMHRTGHWLGLDVHDVGEYKLGTNWRLLEPGMVMTVEPGLYIPVHAKGVARKWAGIGIRIEDDVVITPQGNEVLTDAVPKAPREIEALMAGTDAG